MDRRERIEDPQTSILAALQGWQSDIWTALPGVIQNFDTASMTCEVQPSIQARVTDPDGSTRWVSLPKLVDCPVVFPSGGGCTLTFPLKVGDECLVIFSSRCIDAWWQLGGVQKQLIYRMHDLSDGFVLPGPKSLPRAIPAISTTAVQLRSDDGQAYVEINPTSHDIIVETSADLTANVSGTTTFNVTGNVVVNTDSSASVNAATSANVTAPAINLGASGQSLLSFVTSAFMALFNGHTHTSSAAGTPTSTPNQTMGSSHVTSTVKGG